MRYLTKNEELLVRLVHQLSYGDDMEMGLTLKEIKDLLVQPIKRKDKKNALECIELEGEKFLEEFTKFIEEEK